MSDDMTKPDTPAFAEPEIKRGRGRPPKEKINNEQAENDSAPKRPKVKMPQSKNWAQATEIEIALCKYFNLIGVGVSFINQNDGVAILDGGERLAHELVELGRNDRRFRQYLELITRPGKYGGLIIASGSIIIPILSNHGLMPSLKIPFGNKGDQENENEMKGDQQ